MLAWATLTGRSPSPFEIDLLAKLDAAALSAMNPPPEDAPKKHG